MFRYLFLFVFLFSRPFIPLTGSHIYSLPRLAAHAFLRPMYATLKSNTARKWSCLAAQVYILPSSLFIQFPARAPARDPKNPGFCFRGFPYPFPFSLAMNKRGDPSEEITPRMFRSEEEKKLCKAGKMEKS